jgi:type IV pilus assembly protein PilM
MPEEKKIEVLVIASPKNLVNEFLELTHLARLNLLALETKPIAAVRSLLKKDEKAGFLIVDIGAQSSGLAVVDEGVLHLTGTVNFGSNLINYNLKGLGNLDTEKIKHEIGFDPKNHPKESELIRQSLLPLCDAISKAIKYYHNRIKAKAKIEEVRLCGGGANMPGIEFLITKETGFKTILGSPLVNFVGHIPPTLTLAEARKLTTVIGLALRE